MHTGVNIDKAAPFFITIMNKIIDCELSDKESSNYEQGFPNYQ